MSGGKCSKLAISCKGSQQKRKNLHVIFTESRGSFSVNTNKKIGYEHNNNNLKQKQKQSSNQFAHCLVFHT